MGRMYTVQFDNVSVSAAQDLFEITPASNKGIRLRGITVSQTGVADVGDAAEELLPVQIVRGHTTGGSGGSAPTPVPLVPNDTAAGFTAEVNNTTIASAGTTTTLFSDNFNVRSGYQFLFPDDMSPMASAGNTTIVVRMTRAPADAITLSGTLFVEEMI